MEEDEVIGDEFTVSDLKDEKESLSAIIETVPSETPLRFPDALDAWNGIKPLLNFYVVDDDNDRKLVGKMWGTKGKLTFEGNTEKSAELFMEFLAMNFDKFMSKQMMEMTEENQKLKAELVTLKE